MVRFQLSPCDTLNFFIVLLPALFFCPLRVHWVNYLSLNECLNMHFFFFFFCIWGSTTSKIHSGVHWKLLNMVKSLRVVRLPIDFWWAAWSSERGAITYVQRCRNEYVLAGQVTLQAFWYLVTKYYFLEAIGLSFSIKSPVSWQAS